MEIVWTDLAVSSVEDIVSYIERFFGSRRAQEYVVELKDYVQTLSFGTTIGRVIHIGTQGIEIRRLVFNYSLIYYSVINGKVHILIVWDSRQNPNRLEELLINYLVSLHIKND